MTDTSIDEALLPCPFCGGEAEMIHGAPGSHFVKCKQCGAASDDRFEDSAIAAWNRRSAIASNQAPGFDPTELDMIRHGDRIGPELGGRVVAALSASRQAVAPDAQDALRKLDAGLKLAAIGGPNTAPGNARRQLAEILLPYLEPIRAALAAPVRDETETAIAALCGYQSAVSACLTAGGVPLNESGRPNSWWDDIIAAQQKGAAAIRALSQTRGNEMRTVAVEEFEGAEEMADAVKRLLGEADKDAGSEAVVAIESAGFALLGWAVLHHEPEVGYVIDLSDKDPTP